MYFTKHMYGGPLRINHEAVAVGTNIFSFGGFCPCLDQFPQHQIDVHILDTVSLKWFQPEISDQDYSCVPYKRYGHTVVAHGSNIYLWGGRNNGPVYDNTLYCFNTNTLQWSKPHVNGNIPAARDLHSACVIKNCMYIFGGYSEQRRDFGSGLIMFNFESMMWSKVLTTGFHPAFTEFHTTTVIGNKMYVYGPSGFLVRPNSFHQSNPRMFCLDTSTFTWTCPHLGCESHLPRVGHSAFVYNGFIYIAGGYWKVGQLNDIHRYDPVGCTWKKMLPKGQSPFFLDRIHICQVVNDRVFITGIKTHRISTWMVCTSREHLERRIPMALKHHDDFHVLDMNPSLKDMCMVNVWERLIELNVDHTDDLRIPLSLKRELGTFIPVKLLENDEN